MNKTTHILSSASVRLIALFLTVFISSSHFLHAQVRTERYEVSQMENNVVTYTLPETYIYLVCDVEEEIAVPGEFALYAERYLGVKDAVMSESHLFRLKGVKIGTYGVPVDSLKYSTRFSGHNNATNVTLSSDGLLLAINAPEVNIPALPESREGHIEATNPGEGLFGMTREYIRATTPAKKAQIAAEEIFRLRESRTAVISGESEQPFPDGEAMKVALEGLDKSEMGLMEKFTGTVRRAQHTIVLKGIKPQEGEEVVARFSRHSGILDKDDLRGEPLLLTVRVTERAPEPDERDRKKKERRLSRGVVYTMPGRATITLRSADKIEAEGDYPIAQYGTQEALESVLFTDRNKVTAVYLDAATGGILRVETL